MLTVTTAARDLLRARLDRRQAADDFAMRFTRKKNGWRLRLDQIRPEDKTVIHEGRSVLLMDAEVADAMGALTLDVRRLESGDKLKLSRRARVSE